MSLKNPGFQTRSLAFTLLHGPLIVTETYGRSLSFAPSDVIGHQGDGGRSENATADTACQTQPVLMPRRKQLVQFFTPRGWKFAAFIGK